MSRVRTLASALLFLDAGCGLLRFAEKSTAQSRQIAAPASVHRLLRTEIPTDDPAQLPPF